MSRAVQTLIDDILKFSEYCSLLQSTPPDSPRLNEVTDNVGWGVAQLRFSLLRMPEYMLPEKSPPEIQKPIDDCLHRIVNSMLVLMRTERHGPKQQFLDEFLTAVRNLRIEALELQAIVSRKAAMDQYRSRGALFSSADNAANQFRFDLELKQWVISFDGELGYFSDKKGFRHLRDLLTRPNRVISGAELQQRPGKRDTIEQRQALAKEGLSINQVALDDDVLPDEALQQLKARLEQIPTEIAEENAAGNQVSVAELKDEFRIIADKLAKSQAKSKRRRRSRSDPAYKQWDSARKNIDAACATLAAEKLPKLAEHLERTIEATSPTFQYIPARDEHHSSPNWI